VNRLGQRSRTTPEPYAFAVTPSPGQYVVFRKTDNGDWRVIGEVKRRPGLPARQSRAQAIRDALGRAPEDGEVFAVLLRSEWRLSLEY
jgi:hypothetical protein